MQPLKRNGWYPAHCPVSEGNLEAMMFRRSCQCKVWIPKETTVERGVKVHKPMFQDYLFVALPVSDGVYVPWGRVKFPCGDCSMPFSYLPSKKKMRPLSMGQVIRIRRREQVGGISDQLVRSGDEVILNGKAGAWSGLRGRLVKHVPATVLVLSRVEVDLFGEETRVITVPTDALEVLS